MFHLKGPSTAPQYCPSHNYLLLLAEKVILTTCDLEMTKEIPKTMGVL